MASAAFAPVAAIMAAVAMSFGVGVGVAQARTHADDIAALRDLKAAIEPSSIRPTSCLSSWDFASDPCDNLASATVFVCGFHCGTRTDQTNTTRITAISLDAFGYVGALPPTLATLSSLQLLDVSANAFHGAIPPSISRLSMLTTLDLSRNSISGSIPPSIGLLHRLQHLSLSYNLLQGAIPASINSLLSLQRLHLFNNRLSGSIPHMGDLNHLLFLDVSSNFLSGAVSASLPVSLLQLSLRGNLLQGTLPESFLRLSQLEVMDVSSNSFCGAVDGALLLLPSLQQLNLSNNNLTAIATPAAFANSSQLVAIDIAHNQIRGQLPVFLMQMNRLSALSLRHNLFSGSIPIQYAAKAVAGLPAGARPLMRLYLDGNYLVGDIPALFLSVTPGTIAASFVDNCLIKCPLSLPFCQGGSQKSQDQCKLFTSVP